MAYPTCPDCGTRLYGGRCDNCHEETAIFEDQIMVDGTDMELSQEFQDKLAQQAVAIKENCDRIKLSTPTEGGKE